MGLRFAPIGSGVSFPQVLASEKPPKLCLDVHLGPIETLKALGIEISEAENINFMENLLHCTATSTPQKIKMGDITSFTLFPSGLNSRQSKT